MGLFSGLFGSNKPIAKQRMHIDFNHAPFEFEGEFSWFYSMATGVIFIGGMKMGNGIVKLQLTIPSVKGEYRKDYYIKGVCNSVESIQHRLDGVYSVVSKDVVVEQFEFRRDSEMWTANKGGWLAIGGIPLNRVDGQVPTPTIETAYDDLYQGQEQEFWDAIEFRSRCRDLYTMQTGKPSKGQDWKRWRDVWL